MKKISLVCYLFFLNMSFALAIDKCPQGWHSNKHVLNVNVGAYSDNKSGIKTDDLKWSFNEFNLDSGIGKALLAIQISALNNGNSVQFYCNSKGFITSFYLANK